ncbi:GH22226 [Drosophila grimshawi]|uniref:GH22226 n=1 Tax=Drosophila grimshawi TaxID=7222 RepID=B4K3Z1_DROGR|nr:GH22226 [Drosophila grimshawi]
MAEEVIGSVKDAIKGIFENVTGSPKNETITSEKKPSTPEGIAVAYGSLVIMAMLPIIFGSIRSVKLHKIKKVGGRPITPLFFALFAFTCTFT